MNKKDRLLDVFERLRYEKVLSTKKEFAERIGFDKTNLSSAFSGSEKYLTDSLFNKIADAFPQFDRVWLFTGEGEMLKSDTFPAVAKRGKVIRFWENIEATGGGIMSFDDTLDGKYSEMILPDFTDCTDAMRLVGDSMYPRYKSGQILVFKEWLESFVEFGQTYLIITRSGYRMVKYLRPSPEKDKLTCVSENAENYPPFEIGVEDIHKLYLVKGSVEQNTY